MSNFNSKNFNNNHKHVITVNVHDENSVNNGSEAIIATDMLRTYYNTQLAFKKKSPASRIIYDFKFWKNGKAFDKSQENTEHITNNGKTIFVAASEDNTDLRTERLDKIVIPVVKTKNDEAKTKNRSNINLNYDKISEQAGFKIGGSGKMLACLVLMEDMSAYKLPFDPFESKAYFNRYFKGTYTEVFQRYCSFYQYDEVDVLNYYRNQAKPILSQPEIRSKSVSAIDGLIATFLKITK